MHADSAYTMGHSHTVCQDYALCGVSPGIVYAIVCDGCSSSEDSDVGARLLAHVAKDAIKFLNKRGVLNDEAFCTAHFTTTFREMILKKCAEIRQTLGFLADVFDSTLLVSICVDGLWNIRYGRGDGSFIYKKYDGSYEVHSLKYLSGAPYYLSYDMSVEKKEAYIAQYGSLDAVKSCKRFDSHFENNGLDESPVKATEAYFFSFDLQKDTQQIILTSDGVESFEIDPKVEADGDRAVPLSTVFRMCLDYKNPVGVFVKRRVARLKKELVSAQMVHQDDISFASIVLKDSI